MVPGEVDPVFRQMGRQARRRRRRVAGLRLILVGATMAGGVWLGLRHWQPDLSRLADLWQGGDMNQQLVQVESQFDIAPVVRRDTFADIPGDPLIIPPPDDTDRAEMSARPAPPDLMAEPRLAGFGLTVTLVDSPLMPRDRQLVPSLPSTREEFALFRAERSRGSLAGGSGLPSDQGANGSVSFLRDTAARPGLWRDLIVQTTQPTPLATLLAQNGFSEGAAQALSRRVADRLALPEPLPAQMLVAVRYRLRDGAREVIQMSVHDSGGLVGALALSAAGQLAASVDPWLDQPLSGRLQDDQPDPGAAGRQRLLDLIYAAALRNNLSSEVVGEAIALMARVHDLDSAAQPDDRLTLILAGEGQAIRPGGILYIGITGAQGDRSCYVVPAAQADRTECFVPSGGAQHAASADLSPPVGGVLTQRFVPAAPGDPQSDPARGRVVWTAPQGAGVTATGDGRVSRIESGLDGRIVLAIDHSNGFQTIYDGLNATDADLREGASVRRGQPVGRVGDDGLLGLRLLSAGQPVDPVPHLGGAGQVLASNAVESLIGRIITVESAGNARARNPLSTATGLGQFIEATWLRMMASYRPDLTASLDRRALLELRFDPDLSRQMVRHLAQENEAYLRNRGHAITAGRLYLAHFLGPAGADTALRADPGASVHQVMGAAVVGANPFLRGYSIADLRTWADRKMAGQADLPVQVPVPIPAELRGFIAAIDRLRTEREG